MKKTQEYRLSSRAFGLRELGKYLRHCFLGGCGSAFMNPVPAIYKTMNALKSVCIAVACFAISGCATSKQPIRATGDSSAYVTLIRIAANVDGSERFVFTSRNVRYEHKSWSRPTDVTFDGEPWADLDDSPRGWRDLSRHLDLPKAWIVKREGRDVVTLEQTAQGFDLYLSDSPNGSAHYAVTIAVPRRVELSR